MVILVFAVGQLAVDQVAQCVVGVFDAVVFFEAVAAADVAAFALSFCRFVGKDVVGGVEGEGFAAAALAVAGFLNASDFVVNVIKDAASLVGALNQVAGFVVGVAAVDGAAGQRVLFAAGCLCAAPDGTLAFQTTLIGALAVFGLLRMCRLLLNRFGALKAACTFSGSPKGDAHPASGLRSFEQKPRACVPHTPYIGIRGFMRATAC